MKNNLFDRHIKEQLGNYRPEVPPHVWKKIEAGMDREKPVGFWAWFTGMRVASAVLVLLSAGSLLYYFTHRNAVMPAGSVSSAGVLSSKDIKEQLPQRAWANNSVASTGLENTTAENTAADINNVDSRNNDHLQAADATNNFDAAHSFRSRAQLAVNTAGSLANNNETGMDRLNINISRQADPETTSSTQKFLSGKFYDAELLKNSRKYNTSVNVTLFPKGVSIPCPKAEKDAAGNKKYIEIYGGPDYVFRSISDYNSAAYAEQRKASTHIAFAYSGGIRYTKVFSSGLSIRGGFNYSQVNENFKLAKGHVEHNVYVTDNAGDTTGSYSITGTQYTQSTNKFRSIDIPLAVGYEAGNGRLHTNVNAGVMVNLVSRASGFVVDPNGNAVDIGSDKAHTVYQYRTNTGISLTGAVSVYYKLNDALHLVAEPYIRYSLSPVTQSSIELKQKYNTAGIRLGLRLDL